MAPPVEPRRTRHDADSLLAIAAAVFTERGYDGTSMEHLAQAAGISKSSFYHHVRGKEELLCRSLDRALDGLFTALAAAEAADGRAIERLEHVLRGAVGVLVAELPHVTLLLRVRGNTDTERSALRRRREFDQRLTALVAAAQGAGDLRGSIDPGVVARLVSGAVNSVVEWYSPRGDLDAAALADALIATVLDGLRMRVAEPTARR